MKRAACRALLVASVVAAVGAAPPALAGPGAAVVGVAGSGRDELAGESLIQGRRPRRSPAPRASSVSGKRRRGKKVPAAGTAIRPAAAVVPSAASGEGLRADPAGASTRALALSAVEEARLARKDAAEAREIARRSAAEPAAPPVAAPVDGAASPPASRWSDWLDVHALLTTAWLWNLNDPASGDNQLRIYDIHHNQFDVDAVLTVRHEVVKPGDVGYRLDLSMGTTIPRATAARGLFRDPGAATGGYFDLQQAVISYIVDVGTGLRVDLGKFVSPCGIEFVDRFDQYNDHYSHSFLYEYGPFTHTGISLRYDFHPRVGARLLVTNGWDNVRDNNDGKTVGLLVTVVPLARMELQVGYLVGPERDADNRSTRQMLDVAWSWQPIKDRLNLGLAVDFVHDGGSAALGTLSDEWYGVAGYVKVRAVPERLDLYLRAEWFGDPVSARSGDALDRLARVPQDLYEITLTPALRVTPHFVLRAEGRVDWARRPVFETRGGGPGACRVQPSLALNALVTY